jgi:hypothetical protein
VPSKKLAKAYEASLETFSILKLKIFSAIKGYANNGSGTESFKFKHL